MTGVPRLGRSVGAFDCSQLRGAVADYRASWVPHLEQPVDPQTATNLALTWLHQQRDVDQIRLVSDQVDGGRGNSSLEGLERTSPRSYGGKPVSGRRPVLAYYPLLAAFELASNLARHAALCVVEGFDVPLYAWARTVGALNGRCRNQGWSGRS